MERKKTKLSDPDLELVGFWEPKSTRFLIGRVLCFQRRGLKFSQFTFSGDFLFTFSWQEKVNARPARGHQEYTK
ncbi:MAG: hypothetical protein JEZ14_23825 [Marinilabiliaceae bacterium]|nr:hypothetical protein [Marinilabiliaceae bacterium]MBI9065036.1 hypothetical protein [Marinilabiliaceae bacterium]